MLIGSTGLRSWLGDAARLIGFQAIGVTALLMRFQSHEMHLQQVHQLGLCPRQSFRNTP